MISFLHENDESRITQSAESHTVVSPLNSKIRYMVLILGAVLPEALAVSSDTLAVFLSHATCSLSFLKTKNNNMVKQTSPKMTTNFFFISKPNR